LLRKRQKKLGATFFCCTLYSCTFPAAEIIGAQTFNLAAKFRFNGRS